MNLLDPIVIENALPQQLADDLEKLMVSKKFPWYFLNDITTGDKNTNSNIVTPGFTHLFFNRDIGVLSNHYDYLSTIPIIALDKIGYNKPPKIMHSRAFMHLPLTRSDQYVHDNTHIDIDHPHVVCLYYVSDSEGDTFIYDKSNEELHQKISPKKNRVVFFDGLRYHASSLPIRNKRIVVNFDLDIDVFELWSQYEPKSF
jgi:hypothetical protein